MNSWPFVLLLAFLLLIRVLPAATRPAAPDSDCGPRPARTSTHSASVDVMERCLALRPDDVELMIDLATAYEVSNRLDSAEALYRRALAVDPVDGDLRRRLDAVATKRGSGT